MRWFGGSVLVIQSCESQGVGPGPSADSSRSARPAKLHRQPANFKLTLRLPTPTSNRKAHLGAALSLPGREERTGTPAARPTMAPNNSRVLCSHGNRESSLPTSTHINAWSILDSGPQRKAKKRTLHYPRGTPVDESSYLITYLHSTSCASAGDDNIERRNAAIKARTRTGPNQIL